MGLKGAVSVVEDLPLIEVRYRAALLDCGETAAGLAQCAPLDSAGSVGGVDIHVIELHEDGCDTLDVQLVRSGTHGTVLLQRER